MAAGLQIINTSNTVLIDSEVPCLVHVATYTHADFSQTSALGSVLTLTDATNDTIIAYQGSGFTTLSHVNRVTASRREYWWASLTTNTSSKFYRFERVRDLNSKYGLVLRDSAGNVTFDAVQKPARVVGVNNLTIPSGRSYAMLFAQSFWGASYFQWDPEDGQGLWLRTTYTQSLGRISGQTFESGISQTAENTERVPMGTPAPQTMTKGSHLVVALDVTGY